MFTEAASFLSRIALKQREHAGYWGKCPASEGMEQDTGVPGNVPGNLSLNR